MGRYGEVWGGVLLHEGGVASGAHDVRVERVVVSRGDLERRAWRQGLGLALPLGWWREGGDLAQVARGGLSKQRRSVGL